MVLQDPVKFYFSTRARVPFLIDRDDGDENAQFNLLVVDTPEGAVSLKGIDAHYFACAVTQFQEYFDNWYPSDNEIKKFMAKLALQLKKPQIERDHDLKKDMLQFAHVAYETETPPVFKEMAEQREKAFKHDINRPQEDIRFFDVNGVDISDSVPRYEYNPSPAQRRKSAKRYTKMIKEQQQEMAFANRTEPSPTDEYLPKKKGDPNPF